MASKHKLVSMSLLAMTLGIVGCASNGGSSGTPGRDEILPYWLSSPTPRDMEPAPAPTPTPAPAPVATGTCANYRPAVAGDMNVSELAFPTGDKRSSALLVQQVMPKQVRANSDYPYEIHVTNITSGELQNVVVNGESVTNMNIVSSTPAAGRSASGGAQWVLGNIPSCKTMVIKGLARASAVGTASACLSVTYNNTLCVVTNVVQPALALTKTMTASAMTCDPIVANFEVKNTGTGTAEGVVIKDNLPSGLTTTDGRNMVEIPVGTLAAGQSATRSVNLKATGKGRYENEATASSAGGLTATSGKVAVVVTEPVLAIAMKCPQKVFVGRNMAYEITVRNTGDGVCNNTQLNVPLPSGATFVQASDGGVASGASANWNLGTIPAGGTKTVTMTLSPTSIGNYRTTATVSCACAKPATADCTTELAGIPAILVECIDVDDPDEVGTDETYIITVTNQGSAPGTGIKVVAEIPAEMSYLSSTGPTTGTAAGQKVTFAPLPSLAPKAKAEWRVQVKCNKPGDVRFRLEVTSDQFTNPIIETESTNLYQ